MPRGRKKTNNDGEADTEETTQLIKERKEVRKRVTIVSRLALGKCLNVEPSVTTEWCTQTLVRLTEIENLIGEDGNEDTYCEKIGLIIAELQEGQPQPPPPNPNTPTVITKEKAKIAPFDGKSSNYRQFEELFEAKYERTQGYTDAEKFMFYKELMCAEAKTRIDDLRPNIDGLQEAKRRIKKLYDDPYKIREETRQRIEQYGRITNQQETSALNEFVITAEQCRNALVESNAGDDYINVTFYRQITRKLPFTFLKAFKKSNPNQANDNTKALLDFVRSEIELNELLNEEMNFKPSSVTKQKVTTRIQTMTSFNQSQSPKSCLLCSLPHPTIFCRTHDAAQRKTIALQKRLCFRCLRDDHRISHCTSTYKCPCGGDHSSTICNNTRASFRANNNNSNTTQTPSRVALPPPTLNPNHTRPKTFLTSGNTNQNNNESNGVNVMLNYSNHSSLVTYYQTCLVKINNTVVRILLDSAAGRSLVLQSLVDDLGINPITTSGLNIKVPFNNRATSSKEMISVKLEAIDKSNHLDVMLNIVPSFGNLKMQSVPDSEKERIRQHGFELVDIDEGETDRYPIQILLGLEYYGTIWNGVEHQVTKDLYVRNSIFGHVVFGVTDCTDEETSTFVNILCTETDEQSKNIKSTYINDQIENEYLENFSSYGIKTHTNGKYEAELPWLDPTELKDNYKVAQWRFERLVKHLRLRNLYDDYESTIREMINQFAEPVDKNLPIDKNKVYYLPHHCVIRMDKETTKVRLVFDGSSHANGAKSLNENLFKGINKWDSFELFLRFRFGTTAVLADIEKAFLMINIAPKDRDALRFLWFNEHHQLTTYRMTVVPFGTTASPFLLYAVLQKHFKDNREQFAEVVPLIENSFYVDDLIKSTWMNNHDELKKFQEQVVNLLSKAKMNIRKWRTNVHELDSHWSPGAKDTAKVLGHTWNVKTDELSLAVDIDRLTRTIKLTKRTFSSFLSSIYDTFGMVLPFTVTLRLFLRKLWKRKVNWDDEVPADMVKEANILVEGISAINRATIKRNIVESQQSNADLLVFCDANINIVGAVAYSRVNNECHFIMSKAKLAREATIPELELDALFMAAELINQLCSLFKYKTILVCSDSLPNLQRLVKHPNSMKPSVAIRIAQLKKLATVQYRHVESKQNIADIITRGSTLKALLNNNKWWNAPSIATTTKFELNAETQVLPIHTSLDANCDDNCVLNIPDNCAPFSSYRKVIKMYQCLAKFMKGCKKYETFSVEKLALIVAIKRSQREHFNEEIKQLELKGQIPKESQLRKYNCFLDSDSLLRLRTRLERAINLTYDQKYPIILYGKCTMATVIINNEHERMKHSGVERTLEAVRNRYFVLGARKLVKKVRKRCYLCKWIHNRVQPISFGALPSFRTDEVECSFTNVGVDIFGPLKVNMTTKDKRYGLIFSCATTRAVHLEVLNDITADQVFLAMRRFIGRRGIPHVVYSDNGTQLVAIKKRLHKFFAELRQVKPDFNEQIDWKLQTAISPWRGGFYERLIRSIKSSLMALTFKKSVTDVELITVMTEVESHLNSRPLFSYEDEVITPSHFFTGKSLTRLPPIGNIDARNITRIDIIDQYIKSQRVSNAVWLTWRSKYLLELRQYHQNVNTGYSNLRYQEQDIVLLKNEGPIDQWPLGRIVKVHLSPDGLVRSVDVFFKSKVKTRSIQTIIPLECQFLQEA